MSEFSLETAPVPARKEGQKILIISSHPAGEQSFCNQLVKVATETLEKDGNAVFLCDLVAIDFKAVPSRQDFIGTFNADRLDLQDEQKFAARGGGKFAPDVQAQMDMLVWCDVVIHVFPLHWWSLPAIHKGWIDRIMAYHWCYGTGEPGDMNPPNKFLAGRKWMMATSSGGPAFIYNKAGSVHPEAPSIEKMLWSFTQATPNFCGFEALPLFHVGGARTMGDANRGAMVEDFANHVRRYILSQPNVPRATITGGKPVSAAYEYETVNGKSLSKSSDEATPNEAGLAINSITLI